MRLKHRFVIPVIVALSFLPAHGQLKEIPSQAELDPILDRTDKKLADFLSTLNKYQTEASEIDRERLLNDQRDFEQLRKVIVSAHGGTKGQGFSLGKMVAILSGVDDAAMEAAVWSNLLTTRVCTSSRPRLLEFALAVQDNGGMLREAGDQLLHPTLRMASAADEVISALGDSGKNPQR